MKIIHSIDKSSHRFHKVTWYGAYALQMHYKFCHLNGPLLYFSRNSSDFGLSSYCYGVEMCLCYSLNECTSDNNLPVSEHVTNDSCWCISESIITHSSPGTVMIHFKTSFSRTWANNQSYWNRTMRLVQAVI